MQEIYRPLLQLYGRVDSNYTSRLDPSISWVLSLSIPYLSLKISETEGVPLRNLNYPPPGKVTGLYAVAGDVSSEICDGVKEPKPMGGALLSLC